MYTNSWFFLLFITTKVLSRQLIEFNNCGAPLHVASSSSVADNSLCWTVSLLVHIMLSFFSALKSFGVCYKRIIHWKTSIIGTSFPWVLTPSPLWRTLVIRNNGFLLVSRVLGQRYGLIVLMILLVMSWRTAFDVVAIEAFNCSNGWGKVIHSSMQFLSGPRVESSQEAIYLISLIHVANI